MDYTDDVRGIIIGGFTFPYEFWTEKKPWGCGIDIPIKIDKRHFSNDEDAIEWFKEKYPEEFKAGVEMRVFDK
jgi:hypothetical protein